MKLAQRMSSLGTDPALDVLAKAKALEAEGVDMVHLEIGEPDFDTPSNIVAAAEVALGEGYTHYCQAAGINELRAAIAREFEVSSGVEVDPNCVVVTPGGKPVMFYTLLALLEPGDEAIYPNPGFLVYESMINFAGAKPVPLPLREGREFRVDVNELRSLVTPRTRLLIINSPHNPTGAVLEKSDLNQIAELAIEKDIVVLSDEVYRNILYDGRHISIASLPKMLDRTIVLDSFSKTYAMTGWRLGWGVMPAELVEPVTRLIVNSVSCTAAFMQRAGIRALTDQQDSVAAMACEFRQRRDLVVNGLNAIPGITCLRPRGAFYVFPNVSKVGMDCRELADHLLRNAGVATLPGTAFGEYGDGYLRLSYATSSENLRKALDRIRDAVEKLPVRP